MNEIKILNTECAKGLANGSCGGYVDGKCETDKTKNCFWVLVYEKLKNQNGAVENFTKNYIKPK
jgi:hypothetical protein